jgi:hypothetical protein
MSNNATPHPRRRYLTFSLRTLFILLTASAAWIGIATHRAREQRAAVQAIESLGAMVIYDWQNDPLDPLGSDESPEPAGPAWLRRMMGNDFFQEVSDVDFGSPLSPTKVELRKAIPQLQRLRALKKVRVFAWTDLKDQDKLQPALPNCEVQFFYVDNSPRSTPVPALR